LRLHNSFCVYLNFSELHDNKKITFFDLQKFSRRISSFHSVNQFLEFHQNSKLEFLHFNYAQDKPAFVTKDDLKLREYSISVFLQEIFPAWEDPVVKLGGELSFRISNSSKSSKIWRRLVLSFVGDPLLKEEGVLGI